MNKETVGKNVLLRRVMSSTKVMRRRSDYYSSDVFGLHLRADKQQVPHAVILLDPNTGNVVDVSKIGAQEHSSSYRTSLRPADTLVFGTPTKVEANRRPIACFTPSGSLLPLSTSGAHSDVHVVDSAGRRCDLVYFSPPRSCVTSSAATDTDTSTRIYDDSTPCREELILQRARVGRVAHNSPPQSITIASSNFYNRKGKFIRRLISQNTAAGFKAADARVPNRVKKTRLEHCHRIAKELCKILDYKYNPQCRLNLGVATAHANTHMMIAESSVKRFARKYGSAIYTVNFNFDNNYIDFIQDINILIQIPSKNVKISFTIKGDALTSPRLTDYSILVDIVDTICDDNLISNHTATAYTHHHPTYLVQTKLPDVGAGYVRYVSSPAQPTALSRSLVSRCYSRTYSSTRYDSDDNEESLSPRKLEFDI